jgi:hypothetical protein
MLTGMVLDVVINIFYVDTQKTTTTAFDGTHFDTMVCIISFMTLPSVLLGVRLGIQLLVQFVTTLLLLLQ